MDHGALSTFCCLSQSSATHRLARTAHLTSIECRGEMSVEILPLTHHSTDCLEDGEVLLQLEVSPLLLPQPGLQHRQAGGLSPGARQRPAVPLHLRDVFRREGVLSPHHLLGVRQLQGPG